MATTPPQGPVTAITKPKEQSPPGVDVTIYVTKPGTKSQRDGWRYLTSSKIPIKLSKAKAKGYRPWSVCRPPESDRSRTRSSQV